MAVKKKKSVKKKVKKKTKSVKKKSSASKKRTPAKKARTSKNVKKKTPVKKKPKSAAKKSVKKAKVKKKPRIQAKKPTAKKAAPKPTSKILAPKKPTPKKAVSSKKKVVEPPEEIIKPVVRSPFKDDDPKILKIQERLVHDRKRLMGMLRSSKEVERTINDITFSNEIDLASSLEGREMAFQLSSRERNELRMVEDALFKIKGGTYGVCDNCSKYITLKRLEILPLTALCIECQENLEVL